MRIVNPTFGILCDEKSEARNTLRVDWIKDPIIFFGNSKPNFKELVDGIRLKLASLRSVDRVDYIAKPAAGVPATIDLIEAIAGKYKIALLGSAD